MTARPAEPPLSPAAHLDRRRDDLEDDAVRALTKGWVAERRLRQDAERDRRFRLAGITESELRLLDGNR